MAYSASNIANEFISLAEAKGKQLTPMQIIKLTYIAHGFHLALTNGVPLVHEDIEAWKYGPVINDLYHKLKSFGNGKVDQSISTSSSSVEGNGKALIEKIYDLYGSMTGAQLSNLTHLSNSPWDITVRQHGIGAVIKQEDITNHYAALLKE